MAYGQNTDRKIARMGKKWQVLLHYGQTMAPVGYSLYLLDLDKKDITGRQKKNKQRYACVDIEAT